MARRAQEEWKTLDKDLRSQGFIEHAGLHVSRTLVAPGLAILFLALSGVIGAGFAGYGAGALPLAAATVIAAYVALNIGANDIGNNLGPVIGARAARLGPMLALAALAEAAGAILAGGPVVRTIGFHIVPPGAAVDPAQIAAVMLAGLIAAGLWVNLATLVSASVSTTHSVVGGIIGAAALAFGPGSVDWMAVLRIALGWVISPVLGGAIAAGLLAFLTARIDGAEDRRAAALLWVPRLTGLMAGAFTAYLMLGGIPMERPVPPAVGLLAGLVVGAAMTAAGQPLSRRRIARFAGEGLSGRALRALFAPPLIGAALLFSFTHGANDVSNAIGPLAAIIDAGAGGAATPHLAAMAVGGIGIGLGVLLFGPRLVRVVGTEITRLNPVRASCVLLSTAITAAGASLLGQPVSSTHIALGGIFGIGFWREAREARIARHAGGDRGASPPPEERRRRRLVRRSVLFTMIGAWTVTVPCAALLAALVLAAMRLLLAPLSLS